MAESPFEDPEVKAALAQAGIAHKPGMAADMMEQLSPLLAEEGIDLDDPDTDLDTLNAALARATERHNLELFTPVGNYREQALQVIAEFAHVATRKRSREAEAILDSIEPEPTSERPAASHVIGVSLGLLDTWYTDPDVGGVLTDVPIPKWRGPARTAAADLIKAARHGEAYESLDALVWRHGGLFTLHAGVLAAAATILASAERSEEPVARAAERLLGYSSRGTSTPAGTAFGAVGPDPAVPPTPAASQSRSPLARQFAAWLSESETDPTPVPDPAMDLFSQLEALVAQTSLDLANPNDVAELVETLTEFDAQESGDVALGMLHDYVHFQLETSGAPEAWEHAHDLVDAAIADDDPLIEAISAAIEEAQAIAPAKRRAALEQLRIVSGTDELLAWLSQPRPVTATGGLRRIDIGPVAAMIGVHAVGGARRNQPPEPKDAGTDAAGGASEAIRAQSIIDIPVLDAWWQSLSFMEIIELTATRVRRGPEAGKFGQNGSLPVEEGETFVAMFLADFLLREAGDSSVPLIQGMLLATINRLVIALDPQEHAEHDSSHEDTDLFTRWGDRMVATLTDICLVTLDGAGTEIVPAPLRGAVAQGILATLAAVIGDDESED